MLMGESDMALAVMQTLSPLQRLTVGTLAMVCCCLGLAVALESRMVPDATSAEATAPGDAAHPSTVHAPPTFSLPPLQNFAAVAERPLFMPDRQPPAQARAQGTGAWSTLSLAGVIVTPDARQALIAHGQPPAIAHLQEGQSVDGWTLRSIAVDRVVVANGHEQHELRLFASHADDAQDPAKARGPHPRGR
jgi:hypothetical protein